MSRGSSSPALRWLSYIAVAILFAITCAFLAHWQFARNAERSAQLALVAANYDAAPVPLSDAVTGTDDFDPGYQWHPVQLHGTYLVDDQVVARNRPHGGTSAFEVLTPLKLDDGRILIVNRGWVPAADRGEGPVAIPTPPPGQVSVIVRLRPGEALPSSRSAPAGQVPTINLPLIAETTGPTTVTTTYGALVSETPAATAMPSPLDSPSSDPGPFLSYAVQWILFAVMGFIFIWYVIRSERRHRIEEAEDAEASSADRVPPTRRPLFARYEDSDMTDEDALLDRAGR